MGEYAAQLLESAAKRDHVVHQGAKAKLLGAHAENEYVVAKDAKRVRSCALAGLHGASAVFHDSSNGADVEADERGQAVDTGSLWTSASQHTYSRNAI